MKEGKDGSPDNGQRMRRSKRRAASGPRVPQARLVREPAARVRAIFSSRASVSVSSVDTRIRRSLFCGRRGAKPCAAGRTSVGPWRIDAWLVAFSASG